MLFMCQRGLQGFQVAKKKSKHISALWTIKKLYTKGIKKCFAKFDWLLLPLDNKVIVSVTITDFVFDFGNNRFIKKSVLFSILSCKTLVSSYSYCQLSNERTGWKKWFRGPWFFLFAKMQALKYSDK